MKNGYNDMIYLIVILLWSIAGFGIHSYMMDNKSGEFFISIINFNNASSKSHLLSYGFLLGPVILLSIIYVLLKERLDHFISL